MISRIRQLARKPLFLACTLTVPLWIVLGNFIVAACVALLLAFLLSMIDALLVLGKAQNAPDDDAEP